MCPPQEGTLSTHVAAGTSAAEHMLHIRMENTIVLPEGALVLSNVMDRLSISMMKGLGLNLDALPQEMLYLIQDGIMAEMWARESCAIQVLSE